MNALTRICPPSFPDEGHEGFDIGAFMVAHDILRVGRHGDNFNVYMTNDGDRERFGCGKSFEEALDNARGLV